MSEENPGPSLRLEPTKSKIFTCDQHATRVSSKLLSFYEAGEFCDITLIAGIGDLKIEAHRMVLSASSGYFRAMFRCNLSDTNAREVKLEQWDGETLKIIVDFMYTPSIELRNGNVENVLRAADFFQMNPLVVACCNFMTEQLDPCNCLRIVFFAEQHNYTQLFDESLEFACNNFERVCTEQEFLELNAEQLTRFLSIDDICVSSEKSVLRSVLAWIKHDEEGRASDVLGLLQHIRYPLLEARYIIENRRYLCRNFECQEIVMDWFLYLLSPESRSQFPQAITRPRKTCKKLFYLSGWESNANFKVQTYDPEANEWSCLDWPLPMKRRKFFGTAVVGKQLIIGGGDVSGYTANCVECLDLQTMKWSTMPSMGLPRRWFAMAELDGFVYAIGGIDSMWSKTVVRFDFKTRTWQEVPPMSGGLMYVQAVVLDGLLYAVCSENRFLECYDPLTNKWTRLPNKKENSAQFGLGAVAGCLYAVGGHFSEGRSKTVERYDPRTGEWTDVAPLSVGRSRIAITTYGNRLVAAGGHDGHTFLKMVEEYDPETDEWTPLPPLVTDGDSCSHLITI